MGRQKAHGLGVIKGAGAGTRGVYHTTEPPTRKKGGQGHGQAGDVGAGGRGGKAAEGTMGVG